MFDPGAKEFPTEAIHACAAGERLQLETHAARDADAMQALYGHAVTRIEYAAGQWWAHNGEYSSIIRFCPWCGLALDAPEPA